MRYSTQPPGYDLVLLDLSLPGKSGFDLPEKVQGFQSPRPLYSRPGYITWRASSEHFVLVPNLIKPCDVQKQHVLDAVLRCRQAPVADDEGQSYMFGDLIVDLVSNACFRDGRHIPLTALEFEILEYLVEHGGRSVD